MTKKEKSCREVFQQWREDTAIGLSELGIQKHHFVVLENKELLAESSYFVRKKHLLDKSEACVVLLL